MFRGTCSDIDSYLSTSGGIYSAEEFELKHDFEVEFFDSNGDTIGVFTIEGDYIEPRE